MPFGSERGNIEALAALQQQGCTVLCLISDAPWNTQIPRLLEERGLEWRRVPFVRLRLRGEIAGFAFRNPVRFVRANLRALRVNREFRATHFHSMNIAYVLNFWILLHVFGSVPLIYRAGDPPPSTRRWRMLWRVAMRRVTRVVAISRYIRRALADAGIAVPIDVIYNRPPARTASPADDLPPPDGETGFDFVYVGQITRHKGVAVLVDAFSELLRTNPDCRLGIVGRIDGTAWDAWAAELRDSTLGDEVLRRQVVFTGYREDVHSILRRSGILVVPSLWDEPLGNVVMEAKQAGRGAIVFPNGGLPEMIEHGVDGLVCSDASREALLSALRFYADNPTSIAAHGEAAQRSLVRLGVPEFPQRWLEVYRSAEAPIRGSGSALAGDVPGGSGR